MRGGFVFLESAEDFDFQHNFTAEAKAIRALRIENEEPPLPLSYYNQFLKHKFKIKQYGPAYNPRTGQLRFIFPPVKRKIPGHKNNQRKLFWRRKNAKKFYLFFRKFNPFRTKFRVRLKYLGRRMAVLYELFRKIYKVTIQKVVRF